MRTLLPLLAAAAMTSSSFGCSGAGHPSGGPPAAREDSTTALPDYDPEPCTHLLGGAPSRVTVASSLGRAHALARYFGAAPDAKVLDETLGDVLQTNDPSLPATAPVYAAAIGACAAPAGAASLPRASIEMRGTVAVVVPGEGELGPIPPETTAMAIDVRMLVDSEQGHEALARALRAVLPPDVTPLVVEERICNGHPDERGENLYECTAERRAGAPISGTGPHLPIAVLTSPKLTPLAAYAAALLRARAGAFVVGESVPVAIAESAWVGIGDQGVAIRARTLYGESASPLPDVLAADVRSLDPVASLSQLDWASAPAPLEGASTREPIADHVRTPAPKKTPVTVTLGNARAALVTAYAAARTFFPYFDVVGDGIDARLDETLASHGTAPDREMTKHALERFTEVLHDGHAWIDPDAPEAPRPFPPVGFMAIGEEIVVGRSVTADLAPGDIVVALDGVPVGQKRDAMARRVSGSPQAVRAIVGAMLAYETQPKTITVRSEPGAAARTVQLTPASKFVSSMNMFEQPWGTLGDLGAPEYFYVSLDRYSGTTPEDLPAIKAAMAASSGVVLDLRGYPGQVGVDTLGHVLAPDSTGPKMEYRMVGPGHTSLVPVEGPTISSWTAERQGYTGPLVVLTGPLTQSSAELCMDFIRSRSRATIIGGSTSGADGNITRVGLPIGASMSFTGMIVEHQDGSAFHARGHVPDVEIEETLSDLRAGRDTVLMKAIDVLRATR